MCIAGFGTQVSVDLMPKFRREEFTEPMVQVLIFWTIFFKWRKEGLFELFPG